MQNVIFKFEDGWNFTLVMILGPVGMVIYLFFPHFLKIWQESKITGAAVAFKAGFKKFAWFGFWVVFVVSAFWFFKVGVNRNFVGLTVGNQLVLDYPWPKADVEIEWPEVLKADSESGKFGVFERTMLRLRIETKKQVYTSLWMKSEPVAEARKAVENRMKNVSQGVTVGK